jgi:phage shock protein PspC (stress-responsive transcriptional regulator)
MAATHPTPEAFENSLSGARAWFAAKGLTRPRTGRALGGVVAGYARRYEMNPLVARVLAVTVGLVVTPFLYVPLWVLMPADPVDVG